MREYIQGNDTARTQHCIVSAKGPYSGLPPLLPQFSCTEPLMYLHSSQFCRMGCCEVWWCKVCTCACSCSNVLLFVHCVCVPASLTVMYAPFADSQFCVSVSLAVFVFAWCVCELCCYRVLIIAVCVSSCMCACVKRFGALGTVFWLVPGATSRGTLCRPNFPHQQGA